MCTNMTLWEKLAQNERRSSSELMSVLQDMSGDVSALEVVTVVGRAVCAGAALTAALYLIRRVCLIMAWKSGGASHAELVNNLRSEFSPFCVSKRAKSVILTVALSNRGLFTSLQWRKVRVSELALRYSRGESVLMRVLGWHDSIAALFLRLLLFQTSTWWLLFKTYSALQWSSFLLASC